MTPKKQPKIKVEVEHIFKITIKDTTITKAAPTNPHKSFLFIIFIATPFTKILHSSYFFPSSSTQRLYINIALTIF